MSIQYDLHYNFFNIVLIIVALYSIIVAWQYYWETESFKNTPCNVYSYLAHMGL